jgi:hypothetical protein
MLMMMGRKARTPLTMLVPPPPDEPRKQSPWLQELMEQFRDLHDGTFKVVPSLFDQVYILQARDL